MGDTPGNASGQPRVFAFNSQPTGLFANTGNAPSDTRPLYVNPTDTLINQAAAIRQSLNSASEALLELGHRAAISSPEDQRQAAILVWNPLAPQMKALVAGWAAAMTLVGQPALQLDTNAPCTRDHAAPCTKDHSPCTREHNPVCTREHNPKCTKAHVPPQTNNLQPSSYSDTARKGVRPNSAQDTYPPEFRAAIAEMSKRKVLTNEHIDDAWNSFRAGISAKVAVENASEYAARAPAAKTKEKNLPKGATKTVFVNIASVSPADKAKFPQPGQFVDKLKKNLAEKVDAIHSWCTAAHCNGIEMCDLVNDHHNDLTEQPDILHAEITEKAIRYVFSAPVINTGAYLLHEFVAWHCEKATWEILDTIGVSRTDTTITASTFHYKSTVVFSNILPLKADGSDRSENDFKQDLYASPFFAGAKISRCHFWRPENPPHPNAPGCLFVDFTDDKRGSALKRITRNHHRIGDNFYIPREARQTAANRAAILCTSCGRWGHAHTQCPSSWSHCLECADNHRTADHNIVAKDAPKKCFNCGRAHPTTSTDCVFYEHRFDRKWLFDNAPKYDRIKRKMIYYSGRKAGEARTSGSA